MTDSAQSTCHLEVSDFVEVLRALVQDIEDFGEPRRHEGALASADRVLRIYDGKAGS